MKIEHRAIKGIKIREADAGSKFIGVLTGYAAKFNSNSVRFGGYGKDWIERIAPGAFKRSLADNPDVVALWSHDAAKPAGRTPDTLTVREDETGLAIEIRLVDTATNRDLLTNVRAGIVDSMSFGFVPVKPRWVEQKDADHDVRTLEDVDLIEVSPVVWPAYPETTIGARSHRSFRELRATAPDLCEVMQERDQFLSGTTPAPAAITPQRDIWAARLGNH
jgi:uncharacterized protein